jgi:glycine cleavage system regulatory protein
MTKKQYVVSVLSSDDECIIQSVAKFIAEAYNIRQSHVNHNSSEVK